MGARKLMAWIRQPLTDATLIESRLDIVEALVIDSALRTNVHQQHLKASDYHLLTICFLIFLSLSRVFPTCSDCCCASDGRKRRCRTW